MARKVFNLPESTSRTQTHTITIDKLRDIISISVNTGDVEITAINGEEVTLLFRNGSYSRRVLIGGSYTPSHTKSVKIREVGQILYTYARWNGTSWELNYKTSIYKDYPTKTYNKDGYSGTITRGEYFGAVSTSVPLPDGNDHGYVGELYGYKSEERDYYFSGEVTRPASDTRTYNYYYQYNVTVNYEEGGFEFAIKKDGVLKTATQGWVKVGGQLRGIASVHIKKDGQLKEV